MYVADIDLEVLRTLRSLQDTYQAKFKEPFIPFNYADFHATYDKCAAQIYKETLEEAIQKNEPYHIASKLRCWMDK